MPECGQTYCLCGTCNSDLENATYVREPFDIGDCRCDVEIYERTLGITKGYPIRPNGLIINGTEVLLPEDATITIAPISQASPLVQLTITVFPTSLSISGVSNHKDGKAAQ